MNKRNKATIIENSEIMEEKHQLITETKDQRTFLIGKVISAQRLALDRCNFSYAFAKEKAWVRFVRNSLSEMRDNYHDNLNNNKNAIREMK